MNQNRDRSIYLLPVTSVRERLTLNKTCFKKASSSKNKMQSTQKYTTLGSNKA